MAANTDQAPPTEAAHGEGLWLRRLVLLAMALANPAFAALAIPLGLAAVGCSGLWLGSGVALGKRVKDPG